MFTLLFVLLVGFGIFFIYRNSQQNGNGLSVLGIKRAFQNYRSATGEGQFEEAAKALNVLQGALEGLNQQSQPQQ